MILKRLVIYLVVGFMIIVGTAKAEDIYFTTTPTISPEGKKVVFSYEGDLWMVDSSGGTAMRLTGMQGDEKTPRFSPDGQWIAFSGSQDGNYNVYVMPVSGGKIKQLTFHESHDYVDSWSWDSKYIYFNSSRYNNFTAFKINVNGGTPERMFKNYFNTVHSVVEHPVSHAYFFTDTWESRFFPNRKRYKGAYNPELKSYNPGTKEFIVHTSYPGKDFWPTIDKKGMIYFVSDRFNGEYNLYSYSLTDRKKTRLTAFNRSIKIPQVSANGEKVVFEKDYQLFLYNTQTGKTGKIAVKLFQNDVLTKNLDFNISGKITYFDVSPDGKKLAFVSRGELFVSDIKGKFVKHLETAPERRVREVKWLKDNKTLLFNRTVDGWLNLFKIEANETGNHKETQLSFDRSNNRDIVLNSDRTRALYLSGTRYLKLMDLDTFKSKTLADEEIWGFYNDQPCFSPDDEYIIFTSHRNFEKDLFLHHIQSGKTVNLTQSGVSEGNPSWSPDGKYLFFASKRFGPVFPRGGSGAKIYRLPLEKYDTPFRADEWEKLFREKKEDKSKDKTSTTDKKPGITVDYRELVKRWDRVSPDAGTQAQPYAVSTGKDDEYTVLYISNHDGESYNVWQTTLKPFEKPVTRKIKGAVTNGLSVSGQKDNYYLLVNGKIGTLNLNSNEFKPLQMNYSFRKNLESEFNQMFFEVWANLKENFYDEKFHGNDWEKTRDHYAGFLPYLRSRANLRTLIKDMLGELNSSHLNFNSRGDEEKTFHRVKSMQTGLIFDNRDPYRVEAVVTDSPVDKKGIDIKPGDRLIAVNRQKVKPGINREFYFNAPSYDSEMELTFKREERIFHVKIHPSRPNEIRSLLYDEWIRDNQELVDKKSNRRIAYIHMKDMGEKALKEFLIEMTTEHYNREGLILDLRYNQGGNVHDAVLNFLSQRLYTLWKYRGGEFAPQSNFAPSAGPIVLLVNQQSLSDAEMTAAGFKQLNLGKIIGTETYRWIIFTADVPLVDGSVYRLPSWGCYTLDKKNLESQGVKPDIYIENTFKDRLEGKDPQLEAAVKEVLKQLK